MSNDDLMMLYGQFDIVFTIAGIVLSGTVLFWCIAIWGAAIVRLIKLLSQRRPL